MENLWSTTYTTSISGRLQTGHKDFKLADHYSKLDGEFQKEISEKVMEKFRMEQCPLDEKNNVIPISKFAKRG